VLRTALILTVLSLSACQTLPAPQRPQPGGEVTPDTGTLPATPNVTWARISTAEDVPRAPAPGTFQLHMIDVGTGLSILVRGADFALLFDAGTNDPIERPLRVAAYLAAVLGPSGDDLCVEPGAPPPTERHRIDHLVLSHPHLDHASALDLVLHCYDIGQIWDSGRLHPTVFYREFLAAVGKNPAGYHTAASVPENREVTLKGLTVHIPNWQRFSEGDVVQLGESAKFTILHAEAKQTGDPNENSIVIALELGTTRVLLVGDAESGPRKDPSYPAGDVEEFLIDHHAAQIRADILQVGHHGSKTSSRRDFLEAVKPSLALISTGPKSYGGTTLPDREVLEELTRVGATILRTDEHDGACPVRGLIGGDTGPGGCDAWVITIAR
jgi:beta-lactamase superfamily II metal-dependent hydrolase